MTRRRDLLHLAPGLLLGGCAPLLVSGQAPPTLFALTPKSTFPSDLPATRALVLVESVTATGGLNTTRIALRPSPTELEYYAGVLWVDVLPVMVRTLLVESFENSGKVDAFGDSSGIQASHALLVNIREFQAEYSSLDQPPEVDVRLQARLLRLPRRDSLDADSWVAHVPAASREIPAIVEAFDTALGDVLKNVVAWTATTLAASARKG